MSDLRDEFERIAAAQSFMTLATADETGRPWSSPVWFATADFVSFCWVSSPGTRHSRNLAVRPELAITIFDSRQAPGTGEGAYLSAVAALVPDEEVDSGMAIFSAKSERQGIGTWTRTDVEARLRLYRATAVERFVLSAGDQRARVG
jgi:pyridoxine/pyridoxamine 5'-phosphate oxidase